MEHEAHAFRQDLKQLASTDADVAELLQQLEAGLREEHIPTEDEAKFIGVEAAVDGMLLSFTAYFLFRLAKDWLDHGRALLETSIVERRVALIDDMVRNGWPRDVAEGVVTRCLGVVANRTKDDPILTKVLQHATKYLRPQSGADNGAIN